MKTLALRAEIFRRFLKPIKTIYWVASGSLFLLAFLLPADNLENIHCLEFFCVVVLYILIVFYLIIPHFGFRRWVLYLFPLLTVSLVTIGYALFGEYPIAISSLYVIVILLAGVIAGGAIAFLTASLSVVGCIVVESSFGYPIQYQLISSGSQLIFFMMAVYLGSTLGNNLITRLNESQQKSANLALLLEASLVVSSTSDLVKALPELAQKILSGLPASFVRIDILEGKNVNGYGLAAHRTSSNHSLEVNRQFLLNDSLLYSRLLENPQVSIWSADQFQNQDEQLSFYDLFPEEVKICCLVPLVAGKTVLGFLGVGEARDSNREVFDEKKLEFLGTLANQLAIVIENAQLHQAEQQKSMRLEILYEVANVFGSTIELGELLEKLYQLLIQVIPADTYFVGFADKKSRMVNIELLIDEGERFKSESVPLGEGLIGYVLKNQKPLFIHAMSQEWDNLPVKPKLLGKSKVSQSWMGVPLGDGAHFNGILSVASYKPNVFSDEDLAMLINVAQQAELAFDNAYQYARVEEQARKDSLTGTYNHQSFLEELDSMVKDAEIQKIPIALIMLDLDHFKEYNDHFGHVFGDEILRAAVNAIQSHLKSSDVMGRWGGEEFGVILRDVTIEEACKIANRIRETLAKTELFKGNGKKIKSPTVSQGIAYYPSQAQETQDLVEKADQALYSAKSAGRDCIRLYGKLDPCET